MPVAKGRTGVGYAANVWGQRSISTVSKALTACLRCCGAALLPGASTGLAAGCGRASSRAGAGSKVAGWTRATAGVVVAGSLCGGDGDCAGTDHGGTAVTRSFVIPRDVGVVEVLTAGAGAGCTGVGGFGKVEGCVPGTTGLAARLCTTTAGRTRRESLLDAI